MVNFNKQHLTHTHTHTHTPSPHHSSHIILTRGFAATELGSYEHPSRTNAMMSSGIASTDGRMIGPEVPLGLS